jgi:hypothetical protein
MGKIQYNMNKNIRKEQYNMERSVSVGNKVKDNKQDKKEDKKFKKKNIKHNGVEESSRGVFGER